MNTFSRLLLLTLFGLMFGCKSMTENMFSNNSIHRVDLVTVGLENTSLFKSTFNSMGFIKLDNPIKLEVTTAPYTKNIYSDFIDAKASQSSDMNIKYADSLKQKPKYLKIKVADIISLINHLHKQSNESIKSYLENNQRAGVVTSLKVAYPKTILNKFQEAESVFLVQLSEATYQFQLVLKDGETKHISLKDGVIIDYEFSKPCWKEASQNNYKIVELIGSGNKCASGAYRSPRFIKKVQTDYFKF